MNRKETEKIEYNELVFSRENPKYIYKDKEKGLQIFKKLKVGDVVYFRRDPKDFIWSAIIEKIGGDLTISVI